MNELVSLQENFNQNENLIIITRYINNTSLIFAITDKLKIFTKEVKKSYSKWNRK